MLIVDFETEDGKLVYNAGASLESARCWDLRATGRPIQEICGEMGLGDIGPSAAIPVMEGKSVLFKALADVDAYPLCLDVESGDELVRTVESLEPVFGGVNLEDVSSPKCFLVEGRLKDSLDVPVFHDDQHGTAVIVLAALMNAARVVGRSLSESVVAISGAGAAGIATARILLDFGVKDVVLCDSMGLVHAGREDLDFAKREIVGETNERGIEGGLEDAMRGADAFVGVSVGGIVTADMVGGMADDAVVLALANPVPEIWPDEAEEAGARVVGTGRSDFPNQVNNVLGFPGIFRGALDVSATDMTEGMKLAAAGAIARVARGPAPDYVRDEYPGEELEGLNEGYVIPKPLDRRVVPEVACAVAKAAVEGGVATGKAEPGEIREQVRRRLRDVETR